MPAITWARISRSSASLQVKTARRAPQRRISRSLASSFMARRIPAGRGPGEGAPAGEDARAHGHDISGEEDPGARGAPESRSHLAAHLGILGLVMRRRALV